MSRLPALLLLVAMLASGPAGAAMTQTFQQTGNLGLEVTGVGGGNQTQVNGMLTLSSVPGSAVIQRALLYASQNNNGVNPLIATFNGAPLGAVGPIASDPAFNTLFTFMWDVTVFLPPGVPFIPFSMSETLPGNGIAAIGLIVVWSDPAEPLRTVTIIDGMKQVGESGPETETVTFTGLPAGNTSAWLFTCYDDSGATGEQVLYNGASIGGPIDQNVGINASVLQMSTTSVVGNNTMSIQTGADHMGWMVAATAVDLPPVSVEPGTWGRIKGMYR